MSRTPSPVRCVVWGLGKLGRELVRTADAHPRVALVAAVTQRPAEATDLPVDTWLTTSLEEAALWAPGAWVLSGRHGDGDELVDQLATCASLGLDVVTSSGLFHPASGAVASVSRLDKASRAAGTRVVVAGLNPGFLLDVLVGQLLTLCPGWRTAVARKPSSPASWPVQTRAFLGIGCPPDEADGRVRVSLEPSARIAADLLGLSVSHVVERVRAIVPEPGAPAVGQQAAAPSTIGFVQECEVVLETGARLALVWDVSLAHPPDAGALEVLVDDGRTLRCVVDGSFTIDPYPATASRMVQAVLSGSHLPPGVHGPAKVPLVR